MVSGQWSAVSKDGRRVLLTTCDMCSVYCLMQILTVFSLFLGVSVCLFMSLLVFPDILMLCIYLFCLVLYIYFCIKFMIFMCTDVYVVPLS